MESLTLCAIVVLPFLLSIINIFSFIKYIVKKRETKRIKIIEIISAFIGFIYLFLSFGLYNIKWASWNTRIYVFELHSMIEPKYAATVITFMVIAFIGYFYLKLVDCEKQPPLLSALSIACVYMGIIICSIWCIQTIKYFPMILLALNYILIFIKIIIKTVYEKSILIKENKVTLKFQCLSNLMKKAYMLPAVAFVLLIPLSGIVIAVLFLFGQAPDSFIKAWTETAEWTMSQRQSPPPLPYEGHYLCTVAANGHKRIVKPLRTGKRHGHTVIVNRQLCIANAFEQVIEEKAPRFHHIIRTIYDKTGYPISKHIKGKACCDIVYFIMKPLEWIFLIVLYCVDTKPENRISVQYPHTKAPI